MDRIDEPGRPRPQSKLSPVLLWVVIGAVLFRIVTALMDRQSTDEGRGRVAWQPPGQARALSRASGKPVLYDFTAAWCAPCHLLDKDWNEPSIAEKVNASFVPARIVDRLREDGKNVAEVGELQRRYAVSAFPTLVVAAADGRLIGKLEGYPGREALVRFLTAPDGK